MSLGAAIYVQLDYFAFKFTRHPSGRQTKLRPDVSPSGPPATAMSGPNHSHCISHNAPMMKGSTA